MKRIREIPAQRLLLYLLVVALLPALVTTLYWWGQLQRLQELRSELSSQVQRASLQQTRQHGNLVARRHFAAADHLYIDRQLESAKLLAEEEDGLVTLLNDEPGLPSKEVAARLERLRDRVNALQFTEGSVQTYAAMQETVEELAHPVEVSADDLERILALVEGREIGDYTAPDGRPLMLITDFTLQRKEVGPESEVFLLDMKLLKREFL